MRKKSLILTLILVLTVTMFGSSLAFATSQSDLRNELDEVEEKQPIAIIEAMKMETNILAPMKGVVDKIYVDEAQQVKAGELVAKLK